MNGAAWFAFGVMNIAAIICVVWACLVYIGLLPENDFFRRVWQDCFAIVLAFFLVGLVALLSGGPHPS